MELGIERPSLLWLWGPNSIMVVYMDPLGKLMDLKWKGEASGMLTLTLALVAVDGCTSAAEIQKLPLNKRFRV